MKINGLEIGKHYLLDEPEGNDTQTEVYIVEPPKLSMVGLQWKIHFVKENQTLTVFSTMTDMMVFHELN